MTIETYDRKDTARVTVTTQSAAGVDTDADALILKVMDPDGNVDTYTYGDSPSTIERDSTGNYHADIYLDQAGEWFWWWETTGANVLAQASSGQLVVQKSPF